MDHGRWCRAPALWPCIVLLVLSYANAEELAANQTLATGASQSQEPGEQLGEIVVTATRRSESVEKVPISIEALNQEALAEDNIKGIAELAAMVPGLQFAPNGWGPLANYNSIAIRGFNSIVGASTVGIYLDDTPLQGRMSIYGNVGFMYPVVF